MTNTRAVAPLTAGCLSSLPGVRHGFFNRVGGVSTGIYAGLNCGLGSHDDQAHVIENRRRVATYLCPLAEAVLTVHQVHSATAVVVDRLIPRVDLPKADAVVTRTRGLVIGALAADCAPVLFADPEAGVIAAAHAGWRGAVGGILEATIATMESLGATRGTIRASVGPCINQKNYEVGDGFAANLSEPDHAFLAQLGVHQTAHFDLPGYVMSRLMRAGLGTTERQSPCTYETESLFYSFRRTTHRKEADYGRQISAIVLT
jgi:polyphenol oxidase